MIAFTTEILMLLTMSACSNTEAADNSTEDSVQDDCCEKTTFEWIPVLGSNASKDYETCWGAVETAQTVIDGVKAEGLDTVRIPVFWGNMMKNNGCYTINADYIERVREIVDYCQNADLYTVVNIHHFDEFIIRCNFTDYTRIMR